MQDAVKTAIILTNEDANSCELNCRDSLPKVLKELSETSIQTIIISTFRKSDEIDNLISQISGMDNKTVFTMKQGQDLGTGGSVKNILLSSQADNALIINLSAEAQIDYKSILKEHYFSQKENSRIIDSHGNHLHIYILSLEIFNLSHKDTFDLEKEILVKIGNEDIGEILAVNE